VWEKWFLKIDGIEGDSADATHKGEIDVDAWSFGLTQAASHAGGGTSKASFQDFHFLSRVSKASPKLFLGCATGTHFKYAELHGARKVGKSAAADFFKYKLSDVQITSVQHGDSESERPSEQFTLNFSKVEISYQPQGKTGKVEPLIQAAYDLKQSKKI
jgi:type VI secretion system secreted protein Hcp